MVEKMDTFQEPALHIGTLKDDVDLDSTPTTGEEYLKRVILEAKQCDDVVVAPIATVSNEPMAVEEPSTTCDTPGYLVANQEWQDIQVQDFSNIRMYLSEIRSRKELVREMTKDLPIELPDAEDSKSWLALCSGGEDNSRYLLPKLNIVLSLNQPSTERILEHLVNYATNRKKISHNIGRWIYALLVSLELPLNPDTCSLLRTLAKCCQKIRINLNSAESPEINIHNLFICLVAKYFRQLDLADH